MKKALTNDTYFQTTHIPVAVWEINDVFGRCFQLKTEEGATVETQYQGKVCECVILILQH